MNPISALASSLGFGGQVPKRKVRGFSICSEQIVANQLPLFDLGTEVPKRIVKSWVWLITIRFGLATTMEWRKSTRTEHQHQLAHQCSPNIIGIWEWGICRLMGGAFIT